MSSCPAGETRECGEKAPHDVRMHSGEPKGHSQLPAPRPTDAPELSRAIPPSAAVRMTPTDATHSIPVLSTGGSSEAVKRFSVRHFGVATLAGDNISLSGNFRLEDLANPFGHILKSDFANSFMNGQADIILHFHFFTLASSCQSTLNSGERDSKQYRILTSQDSSARKYFCIYPKPLSPLRISPKVTPKTSYLIPVPFLCVFPEYNFITAHICHFLFHIEVRAYVLFEFELPPSASTLARSYVLQMLIERNT